MMNRLQIETVLLEWDIAGQNRALLSWVSRKAIIWYWEKIEEQLWLIAQAMEEKGTHTTLQ